MTVECDAILLGREAIHGTANASALAALVKGLIKKPAEPRTRYVLKCGKERGVQMIPYHYHHHHHCVYNQDHDREDHGQNHDRHRVDDEGFESDEDLTSLGSSEDTSNSKYVPSPSISDNNNNNNINANTNRRQVSCRIANAKINSSPITTTTGSSGDDNVRSSGSSICSIGTDSANSSGGSDNDETDVYRRENHSKINNNNNNNNRDNRQKEGGGGGEEEEAYQFHEIAFCHTDRNFPRIVVWVVKTKRKTKTDEIAYGLEAVVFSCPDDEQFRTICKHFQELSRRSKLEKPVRYRTNNIDRRYWDNHNHNNNDDKKPSSGGYKVTVLSNVSSLRDNRINKGTHLKESDDINNNNNNNNDNNNYITKVDDNDNTNAYNLIHRIDTDGVTHIEVSRSKTSQIGRYVPSTVLTTDSYEPTSIISIQTPESGNIRRCLPISDNQIESVICLDGDTSFLAGRPENVRKSYGKEKAPDPPSTTSTMFNRKNVIMDDTKKTRSSEKVVRGQYVKVSVDQYHRSTTSPDDDTNTKHRSIDTTNDDDNNNNNNNNNVRFILGNEVRPCGGNPSYSLAKNRTFENWMMDDDKIRKGHRSQQQCNHRRSKSSGPYLSINKKNIVDHNNNNNNNNKNKHNNYNNDNYCRYIDSFYPTISNNNNNNNNSFPNRFFGKLKELTLGQNHHHRNRSIFFNTTAVGPAVVPQQSDVNRFNKRRNSVSELNNNGTGRFYQYPENRRPLSQQSILAKSTPNLKSVIKNKNPNNHNNNNNNNYNNYNKFPKDGSSNSNGNLAVGGADNNVNEPKKVTFSAYATVQVVD